MGSGTLRKKPSWRRVSAWRLASCILASLFASLFSGWLHAERIKDLANVQGVRQNQLIGYGLVVGLDGSGDQTTQTPFTVQSVLNMLQRLGVVLPLGTNLQLKNVAAVVVTTSLPPFAQPGQLLDVTVSSMGNAKSLRGGTLLMTPLKGADNQIYALAQGNIVVGGVGAAANGSKVQVNQLSVGRISAGATVERAVPTPLGDGDFIHLELHSTDFATASRVAEAVNARFGAETATAMDGRVIGVDVTPAQTAARVILNARTGSVVMNQAVTLDSCAVSHGNLSVSISTQPLVSQPAPYSFGQTVVTPTSQIEINKEPGKVLMLQRGASLSEVVKALNAIGATPQDLLAILQAMKAAGSLRAHLEVI